jgi:diguanylate cyclase (GGDEF)-like protein
VDREACRLVGLRSMVVEPLIHNGSAVGALKVFSSRPSAFGEGDVRVLGLMSDLIAAAMFHAAKYSMDELFRQATTDALTGLANRALFLDRLRQGIATSAREYRCLAVLLADVDGLKPINDGHGHRAGDAAIREIARRIGAGIRTADTAARLGGDEFGVVLSQVDSRENAVLAARRMAARCDRPFEFEGTPLELGTSIGVAVCPDDGDEPEILLETADRAMYAEKRKRKRGRAR